ncbi:TPA: hypothetical protein ACU525_004477, partial [Yersinia enterocolitica]
MKGIFLGNILILSIIPLAFYSLAEENNVKKNTHMEVVGDAQSYVVIKEKNKLAVIPGGSNLIIPKS